MATATITRLTRVFRFGVTDLPDPDADMTPEEVLDFYKDQYPTLRFGKVNEVGIENGDTLAYAMIPTEFSPNG